MYVHENLAAADSGFLGCIASIVAEDGNLRDPIGWDAMPTEVYVRITKQPGNVPRTD